MRTNFNNFTAYLKSILTWGLPGLYVIVALFILKYILMNIRIY